jgi:hypothetical protein
MREQMDEQLASLEKKLAQMEAVAKPFGILSEEQDLNDITKVLQAEPLQLSALSPRRRLHPFRGDRGWGSRHL